MVLVSKTFTERSTVEGYHPVSLHSLVSQVFEKLVNSMIVDHLEKCCFFLISGMLPGLLDQMQSSDSCV